MLMPTNLGQEWLEEEELVPLSYNGNGNGAPWWQTAWSGIKEVLATGTKTFSEIAPYIFEREVQMTQPIRVPTSQRIPDGNGGQRTVTYAPYVPGQRVPQGMELVTLPTGQRVLRSVSRAGIMPGWLLPVGMLAGGFFIVNAMMKKERRTTRRKSPRRRKRR